MRIDIRGLLAATVVAAFAASTWQMDPGWAVAPTAILGACGAVRIGRPEGQSLLKPTLIVATSGCGALLSGWFTQYLLCGTRLGLLWGTVAFVCFVCAIAVVATHVPTFAQWMRKALVAAALVLVVAIGIRYYQTRQEQTLMASHFVDVAYLYPSLGMLDIEPSNGDATPLGVRLRVLMGIAQVNQLIVRNRMDSGQWRAASKLKTLLYLNIERAKVEPRDLPTAKFYSQPRLMIWDADLEGNSLAQILQMTETSWLWISSTRVESYKDLSRANKLRGLVFVDMTITDELIDEISKLPALAGVQFQSKLSPTDAQLEHLKKVRPDLKIVCTGR